MKLKLLNPLSFIFSAFMINASVAQTTLYSENFTGGLPAGWQNIDQSGVGAGTWQYTTGKPLNWNNHGFTSARPIMTTSSTGYMLFDSNGQNGGTNDNKVEKADLISPAINLSGKTSTLLQFEHFTYHIYSDTVSVWISTDGVAFTQVWECDDASCAGGAPGGEAVTQAIDISPIADNQSTVYVKFRWVGNYELYWAIDDIKITGVFTPMGVSENINSNSISIYENPVKSELQFSLDPAYNSQGSVIEIFDVTGKIWKKGEYIAPITAINVKELSAGLYFLKISSDNSTAVRKFIKE